MARRKKYKFVSAYLNTYTELGIIGEGGNSTVFKVKDEDNNEYALKLLNKKYDKESIKRFKNEMDYCIKSNHKNIMKVLDNGIFESNEESLMFYVMPLYGNNFREVVNGAYDNEKKLELFNQILEGVKKFHNDNNFHRDLKPENILYNKVTDEVVVADFGISHFNKEELYTAVETRVGSKMANFQYAAPEQRMKGGIVDKSADIYALGLILNELYTGEVPYGVDYKKIGDIHPEYSFLDEVVNMMIKQNKENRVRDIETVQYEIKSRIEIANKNKENEKLRQIKIEDSEETDILIIDPPKLIDVTYDDEEGRLRFKLSHPINNMWVESIKSNSWESILGYDVDRFRFENEYASVQLPAYRLEVAQDIVNYFKSWINNANASYPRKIYSLRESEKRRKEAEIKAEIERKEKIAKYTGALKF